MVSAESQIWEESHVTETRSVPSTETQRISHEEEKEALRGNDSVIMYLRIPVQKLATAL